MVTSVWRDGSRLTPWMLHCVNLLDQELHRRFGVHVRVTSGIRTYADQEAVFRSRYVTAGNVNGRKVYDTRWWNGQLWYRISSVGTVAAPGSSNHEIQGNVAAVDLADTGSDGGIATMGSVRSDWLRANASKFGLVPSGFSFGEAWHYDIPNIFNTPPGGSPAGGGSIEFKEWDEMATKAEIKQVVLEALGSRPDTVLIHYSGAGRNGIYMAAPGFWHRFTNEQWTQFNAHGLRSGIRDLVPVNDRDFDVFKEIYTLNQGMISSVTDAQLATLTQSVKDALAGLGVDANVDDSTIAKIANAAVDRLVARAKD